MLTDQALGARWTAETRLVRKVRHGLRCRRYEAWVEAVPEMFGLSVSSVLRRFIRAVAQARMTFRERRLEQDDIVVLVLDGMTFTEDCMELTVGSLRTGEKKLLGVVQTAAGLGGAGVAHESRSAR